jgi:hypothetical protein
MLPWGHFAVGYLCYSALTQLATDCKPQAAPVLFLTLGTQFPDLIDKPLADVVNVLPSGRSLGHSLVFTLVLFLGVYILAQRYNGIPEAIAFGVGHLVHILADAMPDVVAGQWVRLGFLGWPITPAYRYSADIEGRVITEYLFVQFTSPPHFELVLFVLAVSVWFSDGMPGLAEFLSWFKTSPDS